MSAPTGPTGPQAPGTPYPQPGAQQVPPGQAHPQQPYPQPAYPQHAYPQPGGQPGVPPTPAPPRKSWFARHKVLTALGVVAVLAIVGSALGGGDDGAPSAAQPVTSQEASDERTDAAASDDEAAETEAAEEGDATPAIGDAVRDGKFEFTVTSVETGVESVGDDFLTEDAQGQFVLVHVTVSNIGDAAQYFDGSDQKLVDTEGRTHSADTTAALYLGDADSFLNQVNPGNTVEGIVVFDIPADAVPASIELHDSMFSGGVVVTLD